MTTRAKLPRTLLYFIGLCIFVITLTLPEIKVLTTTQSNSITTTTTVKPKLFTCGFDLWNFTNNVFDDLEFAGRFGETTVAVEPIAPTAQDILVQGGIRGPCSVNPQEAFPGKILFVNSEARKDGDSLIHLQNERFFLLGPTASSSLTSERSLPIVSFGAIFFASTTTPKQREWILNSSKKLKPDSNTVRDAIIYVVNRCGTKRNEAALELTETLGMTIHQNPKCPIRNKHFFPIPKQDWTKRDMYFQNWKLYSKYKYCLVFENTATSNYITEKIFLAFLGGCIPIYWGTEEIYKIFNRNAFVFYDMDKPDRALEEMKRLETNHTAYMEKLQQPILAHGNQTINEYLSLADDIGNGGLKHQIRTMLGL